MGNAAAKALPYTAGAPVPLRHGASVFSVSEGLATGAGAPAAPGGG